MFLNLKKKYYRTAREYPSFSRDGLTAPPPGGVAISPDTPRYVAGSPLPIPHLPFPRSTPVSRAVLGHRGATRFGKRSRSPARGVPFEQTHNRRLSPSGRGRHEAMHMIDIRLQGQQSKAVLVAAFGDERLAGCFHLTDQDLAPILRYPHEVIAI